MNGGKNFAISGQMKINQKEKNSQRWRDINESRKEKQVDKKRNKVLIFSTGVREEPESWLANQNTACRLRTHFKAEFCLFFFTC